VLYWKLSSLFSRYRPVTLADMITDKKFLEYINSEFDVKDADNNSVRHCMFFLQKLSFQLLL